MGSKAVEIFEADVLKVFRNVLKFEKSMERFFSMMTTINVRNIASNATRPLRFLFDCVLCIQYTIVCFDSLQSMLD